MTRAVREADASGTFEGSSSMYATAREWARVGLLFLQDGVWEGERRFRKKARSGFLYIFFNVGSRDWLLEIGSKGAGTTVRLI